LSVLPPEALNPSLLTAFTLPPCDDPSAQVTRAVHDLSPLADALRPVERDEDALIELGADVPARDLRAEDADLANAAEGKGFEGRRG